MKNPFLLGGYVRIRVTQFADAGCAGLWAVEEGAGTPSPRRPPRHPLSVIHRGRK